MSARWFGCFLFVLAACSGDSSATGILVVVDSDTQVAARLSQLHIAVFAPDDLTVAQRELDIPLGALPGATSELSFPLSFALLPEQGAERRPFRLVVTGRGTGSDGRTLDLVEQQVVSKFSRGRELRLEVMLAESCLQQLCRDSAGQRTLLTCNLASGAACEAASVREDLPDAERSPLGGYDSGFALDGSTPAAAVDGGLPADAAPLVCPRGTELISALGCREVDDCVGSPCQHEASCVDGVESFSCDCKGTGYRGSSCEIDINECNEDNVCKNAAYPCVQTTAPGYSCRGQMAEWPMPDNAVGAGNAPNYDVTALFGVVIDNVTKLQWQRERPPQYLGCSGTRELPYDICGWDEAVGYCDTLVLAGRDDWRLPSKIELESILDLTQTDPTIDLTVFPGTKADWYWTSSPYAGTPGLAWQVNFQWGGDQQWKLSEQQYVRCVR